MDVNLILRNYGPLAKRTTFPTTSLLDGVTLGEQGTTKRGAGIVSRSNEIDAERVFLVRCVDSCEPYQVSVLPLKPSR